MNNTMTYTDAEGVHHTLTPSDVAGMVMVHPTILEPWQRDFLRVHAHQGVDPAFVRAVDAEVMRRNGGVGAIGYYHRDVMRAGARFVLVAPLLVFLWAFRALPTWLPFALLPLVAWWSVRSARHAVYGSRQRSDW